VSVAQDPQRERDASARGKREQAALSAGPPRVVLDDVAIRRALMRIAHEIVERNDDLASLYLVGVPNGGVPLARALARNLEQIADLKPLVGVLDTTLYRDDLVSAGARPRLRRTEMPSAVDDRIVVLVDDVCSTGRTIRAAMDALMDFGRPRAVQLVALIDRGHRELPIRIDYVGKNIPTRRGDLVKLHFEDDRAEGPMEVVLFSEEGDGS
jgi:pyrimidine operon attenuation protein/uracil phosphoribosyltransferase